MLNRQLNRPHVSRRLKKSNHNRRTMFFEPLEERRVMTTQFLNFDDAFAPEAFSQQTELTTQYASQGATFSGIGGAGWEVLNDSGNFGIAGYSSPNFVAWNTDVTAASERIDFALPASNLSLEVGSTEAGQFTATAFDLQGEVLGSETILLTSALQEISFPFGNIGSVEFGTTASFGVLDNLQYELAFPTPISATIDDAGNLIIADDEISPNNNQLSVSSDGSYLIFSDPLVPFLAAPTPESFLSNDGKSLSVPLAEVFGNIIVNAGGGDDTLTIDLGDGTTHLSNEILYNGGSQNSLTGDVLAVTGGGNIDTATLDFFNAHDGTIKLTGNALITYVGLEPIDMAGTDVDNLVLNYTSALGETITLADDGILNNDISTAVSTQGEILNFSTPNVSLTITTNFGTGAGADVVNVQGLDAQFDANLTITTSGDVVNFQTNATNLGPGSLVITADVINFNAAFSTSSSANLTATNVTSSAAGTISTGTGLTVTNTGAASTLLGAISGTGGLSKLGAGTLTLGGAVSNSYSGTTSVQLGNLDLSKTGGAIAVPGNVDFGNGVSGQPYIRATQNNQFASSSVMSFVNPWGQWTRFDLQGTTQTLAGINSVSGGGVIQNREGAAVQTGTLIIDNATDYIFSGHFRNGGTGNVLNLVKNGAGRLTLNNVAGQTTRVSHTGTTAVNAGQLVLSDTTLYNSATTVEGGATLSWTGTTNVQNNSVGATTLLKNGATLENINPSHWTVINGAVTVDAGASVTINQNSNSTGAAGRGFFLDGGLKNAGANATVTINAINAGSGVNFRDNDTTFSGTMIVNGIASTAAFVGSGISVGGNTTGLQNADIELNGTMELLNQGIGWANTASGDFHMGGLSGTGVMIGNFTAGGQTRVRVGNNGSGGTFTGTIANGTGNQVVLTKNGGGIQTLSGAGIIYTGATNVNAGTLKLSNTTAFVSASIVNSGGTLQLANEYTTGSTGLALSAAATINLNGGTLTYTSTNFANTWVVLAGAVTASAPSTINISPGNSSNTGLFFDGGLKGSATTTINATTARAGANFRNNNTDFSGTMIVNGIASTIVDAGSGISVGGNTSGLQNANIELNGTMELLNRGSGWSNVASGDFFMGGLSGTGVMVGNFTATGGQTRVRIGNNNSGGTFSGTIADGVGNQVVLTKNGSGTQTLSGVNTYTGPTNIAGGSLRLETPTVTLPSSIGGNVVWLDANDVNNTGTNAPNGSQIGTWVNKATTGAGDFTNANGSLPYVYTSGDTMNGNSLVHFWGGTLRNLTNFGNNVSVFYVGRMSGGGNQRVLASVNNNWLLGYWSGGKDRDYWNNGGNLAGTALDFNSHIYAATGNGTTANAYNIDGTEVLFDTRPLGGAAQGPNGLQLGGWGATPSEQSYADVGELIVFNTALSVAQRLQVTQYLQAKWNGVLPATTAINITAAGASLDLNGVNQTVGSIAGVDGSEIKLGGATLTTGKDNTSTTFSGTITGTGSLSKAGTGILTLAGSAPNTFTGPTILRQGSLTLSKPANVVSIPGDITIVNSLSPSIWMTTDNQLGGSGTLSFRNEVNAAVGNGWFLLNGTTQTLAGIDESDAYRNGVVENSQTGAPNAPTTIVPGTLNLSGSGNYSFNGFLRDESPAGTRMFINKTGSGTQTFVGDRISYTGDTTISGGTLRLTNTTAFRSPLNNSAIVEFNTLVNSVAQGRITGPGVYNKTGAATLRFNGANQIIDASGQFNIQAGTLQNDNNSVNWSGNTASMDISAGAILDLYADAIYVDRLTGSGIIQNGFGNTSGQTGSASFLERLYIGVAGGTSTFDGVIRDNAASNPPAGGTAGGGVQIEKLGTGTITFAGANSYTGLTTIQQGVLRASSASALGSNSAGTIVRDTGSLALDNVTIVGETLIIDSQSTTGQAHLSTTGASGWTGPIAWNGSTATVGNVRVLSSSGTLTIDGSISLNGTELVVDGAGDTVVNGTVYDASALGDLSLLSDGNYNFVTAGETFTGFVDHDGSTGWLLVGRGREGWQFDQDGSSNTAAVNQGLGTPAAFVPANYSDRIINDLVSQARINQTNVEVRIRRALNPTGTTYQEARWRNFAIPAWTWDFDQGGGVGSIVVEHQILSGTGSPFLDATSGTRDTLDGGSDNGFQRIFTWAWGGHNNVQGFSFGGSVVDGANNSTSFLWEFGNEQHAIPYTEIYVRALPASITSGGSVAKTGSGSLTLTGANTYTNGTTINGGTVLVNNTAGSGTGSGAVVVNAGTLGGTGEIAGTVTLNTGASITGGTTGAVGTLEVGAITFNGGTYVADLVGNTSDTLVSNGPVNVNGGAAGIFSLNASGVTSPATVFKLIDNLTANPISNPSLTNAVEGSTAVVNGVNAIYTYAGFDGNDFTLTAAGNPVLAGTGALEVRRITSGPTDVLQLLQGGAIIDSRPIGAFTSYQLTGSAADDTLTVNYAASGGFFAKDIVFDAGAGFDTLIVEGGTFGRVVYNYTNGTDGDIQNYQDAAGTVLLSTITYTGLDPIFNTGTATNLEFNLPNVANFASLEDAGGGMSRLRSAAAVPTFEMTSFVNPAAGGSVLINGGTANDTIAVNSLQPTFAAALTIDGATGTDIVGINRELAIGGNVVLTAESIQLNRANLNSTGGTVTLNGNVQLGGYAQAVLATNPTTYWRFGETSGTTAVDSTGNGNNGTYFGSPALGGNGALGSDTNPGLNLDGVNDYALGTIPITPAFTVDLWARSNTATWNQNGWIASARGANGFIIHPDQSSRQVRAFVVNSSGGVVQIGAYTPTEITGWHHYALSYDPATTTAKFYVDGNLVVNNTTAAIPRVSGNIVAAVGFDNNLAGRFGNGAVDEFVVSNRALTDAEAAQRFQVGGPKTFNGTTDAIRLPAAQFGAYPTSGSTNAYQVSFETWFNSTQSGVILGQNVAGGVPGGPSPGGFVPALHLGTDGILRSSMFWHGSQAARIASPTSLNDGQWHHVAAVYNNGVETLYVDGLAVGSQTLPVVGYTSAYDYHLGTGFTATWAAGNGGWHFFNGQLYEPQVSLTPLTAADVMARFAAGQTASRSNSLVTSNAGVTINGNVSSAVAGLYGLNVSTGNGAVNLNGNLGSATNQLALLNVTTTGLTTLAGNVTTLPGVLGGSGNVNFSGPLSLAADSTVSAVTGAVTFGGTVNGAQALTVNTSGNTTFQGAVGGVTPLTSLATDAGGITFLLDGSVSTVAAQSYGDDVTIAGPTTTFTSNNGANINFSGSIENAAGAAALVVNAGNTGDISVTGTMGGVTALASVNIIGNGITLSDDVFTTGNVTLTGQNQVAIGNIDAGSGLVAISANADGLGAQSFLQTIGTAILTSDNTAAAIGIAVGGTGNASLDTLTAGTTSGTISITVGGTILDLNANANNITAANLALQAGTGIASVGNPLGTTVANLEALTVTGGIGISNTGALQIGNVTGTLSGVDVTGASGDISLTATGSISVSLFNEDMTGPGNITLNAVGPTSDVNTGTAGGFGSGSINGLGPTSLVTVTAGRDVNIGTATPLDYGDIYSSGAILVTAGRDFVLQQHSFLDVYGAGSNTVNAGRDIILLNDGSNSRLTTAGGAISLTAQRHVVVNVQGTIPSTVDSTQGGTSPAGANVTIVAVTGDITIGDGIQAGTAGNIVLSATAGSITDTNLGDPLQVVGNSLAASASTGISLATSVNILSAENTTSGNILVNNGAGGLLTLTNLAPVTSPFAVVNSAVGGTVTIVNSSPLTIAAPVIAAGTVTLTASDSATNDVDHLIVAATVESTTADVFLSAGDDATINAAVTAATDVTINVDYLTADTLGATATINAVITTPLGNYTCLNGNIEADTFDLAPQCPTEVRIFGDDPPDAPGDVLSMDVT